MGIKRWKIWICDYLVLFELEEDFYSVINFRAFLIPHINKRKRIRQKHIYSKAYQFYKRIPPEFEENGVKEVEYIHELRRLLLFMRPYENMDKFKSRCSI